MIEYSNIIVQPQYLGQVIPELNHSTLARTRCHKAGVNGEYVDASLLIQRVLYGDAVEQLNVRK